jgi:hypothetical protein
MTTYEIQYGHADPVGCGVYAEGRITCACPGCEAQRAQGEGSAGRTFSPNEWEQHLGFPNRRGWKRYVVLRGTQLRLSTWLEGALGGGTMRQQQSPFFPPEN